MRLKVSSSDRAAGSHAATLLVALALMSLAASHAAAETPLGVWRVEHGQAGVRVERCAERLCGRIVWLAEPEAPGGGPKLDIHNPDPALRERPILGLEILESVSAEPDQDGDYEGGRIYDPESGKSYRCRLSLEPDGRLRIRGWVGWSLFGRTTHWRRFEESADDQAVQPPARPGS